MVIERHLKYIFDTFDACVEARGSGLMWGIELDQNVANSVFESLKDQNFLVGLGGTKKNVLRVMPPMCITEKDLDHFVDVLVTIMKKVSYPKIKLPLPKHILPKYIRP